MTQDWNKPGSEPPADGNDAPASSDEPLTPEETAPSEVDPAEPATAAADDIVLPDFVERTPEPEQDTTPPEAAPVTEQESVTPVAVAPSMQAKRGAPWLLVFAAALIPAALVGAIVFFVARGDGDSNNAAGIVDGLIRLGPSDQATITSYKDELPPEFSSEFPIYDDADVVVSIAIAGAGGTSYFIVLSADDTPENVYAYYAEALDTEPWQLGVGRSSDAFTGMQFFRPDNINVSGDITLHQSDLDGRTSIYLSYEDIAQAITPGLDRPSFALGATKPLPPGFPSDLPIYNSDDSVVMDTYFERSPGGQAFVVVFLTRDSEDEVINFYTDEFRNRGWNVSDSGVLSSNFALSIEFDDAADQSLQGSITANPFEDDAAYTQVDMLITVASSRGRGN